MSRWDVLVLGSGFSGSILSAALARMGKRVLLVERGRHPRFAVGESTSPLTNLLIEEIADEYRLPWLRPLSTWGTWRHAYPNLDVGLKRGFTFFTHAGDGSHLDWSDRSRQLLVGASPNDRIADTHWRRDCLDEFLMESAVQEGVTYLDQTRVERIETDAGGSSVNLATGAALRREQVDFIVDATGPRGALFQLTDQRGSIPGSLPGNHGLFAHFEGVEPTPTAMDRLSLPPYPADAAAVHHLFPGGWIWVLRFASSRVSAGAALEPWLAEELRFGTEGDWSRLLKRLPAVERLFRSSRCVTPWVHSTQLPFQAERLAGPGWVMLPSAAGFVDPLFSTGFPLTLLGVQRVLKQLSGAVPGATDWTAYTRQTRLELTLTARLIGAAYRCFGDMTRFAALSMIYFSAASFAELARRLGQSALAPGFLLANQPRFQAAIEPLLSAAETGQSLTTAGAGPLLEPFNVAGLCDPAKRNWYGVEFEDAVRASDKLGVEPQAVRRCLESLDPAAAGHFRGD